MRSLVKEDREHKNRSKARRYILDFFTKRNTEFPFNLGGQRMESPFDVETLIRNVIPSVRDNDSKFELGVSRIVLDIWSEGSNGGSGQSKLNKLNQIVNEINTSHTDEYTIDFVKIENGKPVSEPLSYEDLYNAFRQELKSNREYDEKINKNLAKSLTKNTRYSFVKIDSFNKANLYRKHVEWCITRHLVSYNNYTENGLSQFYFALRDDYETCEQSEGENTPLDDYGLSMIAINVNPDGTLKNCTCRWNHQNGGNDHIMTTEQLTRLFGQNFYALFKPKSIDEILKKYKRQKATKLDKVCQKQGWVKKTSTETHDCYLKPNYEKGIFEKYRIAYSGLDGYICVIDGKMASFDKDGNRVDKLEYVEGDVDLTFCNELTTLKGSPTVVGGNFDLQFCTGLTSLEDSPQRVYQKYDCSNCSKITSLVGVTQRMEYFRCVDVPITTLEGCPQDVSDFEIKYCVNLTSLVGSPKKVKSFNCVWCKGLKSLKGAPHEIMEDINFRLDRTRGFTCSDCENLETLEGAPKVIKTNFTCTSCNRLKNLNGLPSEIGGSLNCSYCADLIDIEGAPEKIFGDFYVYTCRNLRTLTGFPKYVKWDFTCVGCDNLKSLEGLDLNAVKNGQVQVPKHLQNELNEMKHIQRIKESYDFFYQ